MASVILRNGVRDEGLLGVRARGVLHGYGAFEVLRVYGGRIFRFEEHCTRLHRGLALLRMQLGCSVGALAAEIAYALELSALRDAHVRVVVTMGEGADGLAISDTMVSDRWVIVSPLATGNLQAPARVCSVTSLAGGLLSELAQIKSNNYIARTVALARARSSGFDDALFFDGSHYWEATAANLFCVHSGVLQTPPLSGPVLPGITREALIDVARKSGLRVREAPLSAENLWTADEVFLSSTIREVRPVIVVDDHEVGDGQVGPVTVMLTDQFRQLTTGARS